MSKRPSTIVTIQMGTAAMPAALPAAAGLMAVVTTIESNLDQLCAATVRERLQQLAAIDLLADDGYGALIDAGRVPALDGCEIGLARLIALSGSPAMALQEFCR
jgi:hypothetical protein